MAQIKIAEYTFDNSVGDTVLYITPTTIVGVNEDVVNGNITTRTVYIDDSTMPTKLSFGTNNTYNDSLLTVEYLNIDSNITALDMCFYRCRKLQRVTTSNWDTSNVTIFSRLCDECSSLVEIDVSHFNVSKANGAFYRMFSGVKAEVLNVSEWNVNTTDASLSYMFNGCSNVKKLDLSNWKVKIVHTTGTDTSIANMFNGCSSLEYLDLSGFDFSEMNASMGSMFANCSLLREIKGIENFNVSSVTNFGSMFRNCSSLTSLDLRNWVTSSATTFQDMFNGCSSLEILRVDNFDTSKVTGTGFNAMFSNCKKVKTLNLNSFTNSGSLGNFINFCLNCSSLEYISMANFAWGNCTSMDGTFGNCTSLKMLDLTTLDSSTFSNKTYGISGIIGWNNFPVYYNSNICSSSDFTDIPNRTNLIDVQGRLMAVYDFNNTVTSTDVYPVLTGSTITKTIDTQGSESYITHRVIGVDVMPTAIKFGDNVVSGLLNVDYLAVTSSCTSLEKLFYNCIRLENINTFGWDVSNVTKMTYAFAGVSAKQIDMSTWNFGNNSVDTGFMFCGSSFEELVFPAMKFGTFWSTFDGCTSLKKLDLSKVDTSGVQPTGMSYAFRNCPLLSELDLSMLKLSQMGTSTSQTFEGWTSDQIVYVHDTDFQLDVSSYNATFVRRLSKLLARYTFDNTVSDCLPKFNNTILPSSPNYKISDMVNGTVTTRLISVDDEALLPTRIHFSDDGYSAGRSIITCDYLNTSNCTSLEQLFYACGSYLTSVNMTGWDTSKVTKLTYAFYNNNQLTEIIGIEDIDTSSLVNAHGIFNVTPKLTTLDLSKWDVSRVEVLSRAFSGCGATTINISTWNTCSATTLENMFDGCGLTELDITHFNTSNVTNLSSMFANVKIPSIDLSGWDVRKVQQTRLMFNSGSITEIKLDGWNTESLTDMLAMFCGSGITTVDINHFNVSKVVNASQLFDQCQKLVSVDMSNLHFTSCQTIASMFSRCPKLTTVKMADFTGSPITAIRNLCYQSGALTEIDLTTVDVSRVTDMSNVFEWATSLKTLDLSTWDTRKVTITNAMFQGWDNTQTVYYEPPFWSIGTTTLNSNINWVIQVTRNNGYWLDMTGITGATEIKLFNENNLPTEEILTDWGDGTQDSELTHTYSTAGEYVVASNLQLGRHENTTIRPYLVQANIYYKTSLQYLFESCTKLKTVTFTDNFIDLLNQQGTQSFFRLFNGCSSLIDANERQLAKLKPNGMVQAFTGTPLQTLDFTGLDTSSMTVMNIAFLNCTKLTEIKGIEDWNTSSLTNLDQAFHNTTLLTSLDISSWNVSNVTTMNRTFNGCGVTTLDLSSWTFKPGVNMYQCFTGCEMTSINLSNTTISGGFQELFYNCKSLETVNLSGATLTGTMQAMFSACEKLTSIDFTGATIKPTNLYGIFNNCLKLTTIDTSTWDLSNCITLQRCFVGCSSLTSIIGIEDWNVEKVTNMDGTFQGCSKLELLDLSSWDVSQCTNMSNMFNGCGVTTLNLKGWNTNSVTNLDQTFRNTTRLQNIDLSTFDTSKIMAMTYCFAGSALQNLDLSSFTFLSNCNCNYMFQSCLNLEFLDISNYSSPTVNNYLINNTKLKAIGMLYSSANSINDFTSKLLAGDTSTSDPYDMTNGLTIYYYDADASQLTPVEGVTFKKYIVSTTIQLPPHIQLHSLPDGTRDEVDIKTGILTKNVGYLVLDNADVFVDSNSTHNDENHYVKKILLNTNGRIDYFNPTIVCPKIKSDTYSGFAIKKYEFIAFGVSGHDAYNSAIYMKLKAKNSEEWNTRFNELSPIPVTFYVTPTTEQLILNYNNSCDYGRILPTGMCDKYSVVDSMYTQTMTSILLDGANTWDAMEEFENTVKFTATGTTVGVEDLNMLGAGGLYCDNDLFPNINDDSDVPHCRVDEAGNKFYIYVDKEMLMSPDLIGWQIWLQANKFNLIYELAEHLTYVKPYEELDPTQARWEGMDCIRDGAISYHTNSSDNITMYPTLEYVAPSINNFEVPMLEPNTDYTIYAEGIDTNDTINLGGTDINFNNGTVYTSGDNQWLRIDNNDSFYNMVITKGDTTGEVVPYFKGMTSVENVKIECRGGDNLIGICVNPTERIKKYKSHLKPNTNYTLIQYYTDGSQSNGAVTLWNNGAQIAYFGPTWWCKFTTPENITSETLLGVDSWNKELVVLLLEGTQSVQSFEAVSANPYKLSTISYTDLKLRSLPNGVKDTVNVVTGEYVQRVGEVVLDGSEKWGTVNTLVEEGFVRFYTYYVISDMKTDSCLTSDKLSSSDKQYGYGDAFECIAGRNNNQRINVKLKLETLGLIDNVTSKESIDVFQAWLNNNNLTVQYELAEPIITKLDPQTLLAYTDGTINLSSDTGLLPTAHYTVPSTNTFHLPSMKTGTRYTLKYPSASGSITIGDINYSISSDSMLFTTPLKINGDTSAIIFSDANPENVVLLEGAYNKREVPFFTGVKSVKNPNITIIDQLSTESTTYNCETEIELRGLPNGVADKLDIVKGKLTTNVGIRPYQEGDENLPNIWTDGYETVYALSSPVVTNVTIDHPTVTTNSLIELSSDYLIPQLNYRAPSSNNFPLDLLQPNTTYTLYADTLVSGSYTLGGTRTGVYSQPHTITLGDMTDNLLTFNGDLGLSNVMLVKGNSLKTTLPPYFLGIRSVTDGHLLVEGMAGEINELTFDEGIVLRDCSGVKDTIDLITCTLTKRTGEITLTGAEGWYRADSESTTDYNVFKLTLSGLKEALVMCDTLQSVFDTKMMDCIHAHINELCIVIANATIGGNTVNALKSWLNQHHTTVVYQLRTPIEVQLENVWTTTPPTSYDNQTEISSTVSTNSLKPMISVTIATTTLEEIVTNLEAQNAQLEEENMATMLALTSVYETMAAPMAASTMSLDDEPSTVNLSDGKDGNNINGMSVSPIGMVYVNLIRKGLKTIEQVPYNLQAEVMYALRGME